MHLIDPAVHLPGHCIILPSAPLPSSELLPFNHSPVFQLTEEKLGTSERTELDANLENLVDRAECARNWTEKIVKNSESVLIPNPGNRVEDFIFEKIEKKKPTRLSNLEYLGQDMIEVRDAIIYPTSPRVWQLLTIVMCN